MIAVFSGVPVGPHKVVEHITTMAQSRNVVLDTFENALAKLLCNYIVNWNHGART